MQQLHSNHRRTAEEEHMDNRVSYSTISSSNCCHCIPFLFSVLWYSPSSCFKHAANLYSEDSVHRTQKRGFSLQLLSKRFDLIDFLCHTTQKSTGAEDFQSLQMSSSSLHDILHSKLEPKATFLFIWKPLTNKQTENLRTILMPMSSWKMLLGPPLSSALTAPYLQTLLKNSSPEMYSQLVQLATGLTLL